MTPILQIGDRTIQANEILPLLTQYQLLRPFVAEVIVDQAIQPYTCSQEENLEAHKQFYAQHKISSDADWEAWLKQHSMQAEQFEVMVTRPRRLEQYKRETWGHKLESYFLKRKGQLDRVIYSLIRTQDGPVAQELYFRIQEGEQSFADVAREYSQGSETQTGGLIGPVSLSTPHPTLAKLLSISQPGQLWPPTKINEWFIIVRLEKFLPVQFDEAMQKKLLDELFNEWLQTEIQTVLSNSLQPTVV